MGRAPGLRGDGDEAPTPALPRKQGRETGERAAQGMVEDGEITDGSDYTDCTGVGRELYVEYDD